MRNSNLSLESRPVRVKVGRLTRVSNPSRHRCWAGTTDLMSTGSRATTPHWLALSSLVGRSVREAGLARRNGGTHTGGTKAQCERQDRQPGPPSERALGDATRRFARSHLSRSEAHTGSLTQSLCGDGHSVNELALGTQGFPVCLHRATMAHW